jgi:hypothetical protein
MQAGVPDLRVFFELRGFLLKPLGPHCPAVNMLYSSGLRVCKNAMTNGLQLNSSKRTS